MTKIQLGRLQTSAAPEPFPEGVSGVRRDDGTVIYLDPLGTLGGWHPDTTGSAGEGDHRS